MLCNVSSQISKLSRNSGLFLSCETEKTHQTVDRPQDSRSRSPSDTTKEEDFSDITEGEDTDGTEEDSCKDGAASDDVLMQYEIQMKPYHCFLCPDEPRMSNRSTFTKHLNSKHVRKDSKTDAKVMQCPLCDHSTRLKTYHRWGLKKRNGKAKRLSMTHAALALMLKHVTKIHCRPIPSYVICWKCPHPGCNFQTFRKYSRRHHLTNSHLEKSPCDKCGCLLLPADLEAHIAACDGNGTAVAPGPSYQCHVCSKMFRSLHNVQKHIQNVHLKQAQTFPCTRCPQVYKSKNHLDNHYFCIHGDNISNRPVFECSLCSFKVSLKKKNQLLLVVSSKESDWQAKNFFLL